MINNLNDYKTEIGKDNRIRAYSKITHKVVSYPRLLMENHLNRKLLKTEDVHHKDGNPLNNDISNLEVLDHREHDRLHAKDNKFTKRKKYNDKEMICPICDNKFIWTSSQQSQYYSKNRSGGPFCSKKCAGTHNQKVQAEKGLTSKYNDKIVICVGCHKSFLYTAKSQRDHRLKTRNKPYCSIECVYKNNTKYTDEFLVIIQDSLIEHNGHFAEVEKLFNIPRGRLRGILKYHKLPYHSKDYKKNIA